MDNTTNNKYKFEKSVVLTILGKPWYHCKCCALVKSDVTLVTALTVERSCTISFDPASWD